MFVYDVGDVIGFAILALFGIVILAHFVKELIKCAWESVKSFFSRLFGGCRK